MCLLLYDTPLYFCKGGLNLAVSWFRVFDDANNQFSLAVPNFTAEWSTIRGVYSVAELIQRYAQFPIEVTWFTTTSDMKTALQGAGLPLVYAIQDIIDSGNVKWYFDEGKTHYIQFSKTNSYYNGSIVAPGLAASDIITLTTRTASNDQYVRAQTFMSYEKYDGLCRRAWFNNAPLIIDTYGIYYYPNGGNVPESAGINASGSDLFWANLEPVTPPTDPYTQGGGPSSTGGGRGTFSRTGDTIDIPSLPTLSAVDAGFITLFKPSISELSALASYMWTGAFDLDTFKKIFANPMDCILGMSIVPVAVPSGGSSTVKVGNISTGISMTKASTQYVELNCGSLKIEEYWGAYLDYAPYTKAQIYLPYIGMRELDIDDVMNKTLKVVYHIDILSGACIAYIQSEGTVVYSFIGQCSSSVPISGNDWTNVVNGVLNIAGAIGSTIATGGLAAPISGIASIASTVTSSKPSVERSGAVSGTGGLMGVQTPYLVITWPKECVPDGQNSFIGYPSFITSPLNGLTGFNKIASIHLVNVSATENEKIEIEALLKEGVIF